MYCRNCGKTIDQEAAICIACGYKNGHGNNYCFHCGSKVDAGVEVCLSCGFFLEKIKQDSEPVGTKSKMIAGLLGVLLGGVGAHNFYLGFTGKAVAQILVSMCTIGFGGIWGVIEGILIFCGKINKDAKGEILQK